MALKDYDIMDVEAYDDKRLEESESGRIQATRVYIKSEADRYIAELKAENERLTIDKRNEELRADQADATVETLKEKSPLRATKRALWLARAERAHSIIMIWNIHCYQNNSLYYRDFLNTKCNPFRSLPKKTAMEWSELWESIETKCRAKAEECK